MRTITVLEHGSITVSDNSGPNEITEAQAFRLLGLAGQYRTDVFKFVSKSKLKALQFVGIAQAGDVLVEVLPKISELETKQDEGCIRKNLIAMLAKTRKLDVRDGEITSLASQNNLLEIIVRLYCDRLFTEVHRGLLKRYERQEENLFVLRGKLDTTRQAKFNAAHPERFFCQYDEFHADNPINQVLKAAVVFLRKRSVSPENQRRLNELYFTMDEISEVHPSRIEWHRIHLDRTSKRFHTLLKLAQMFLHNAHQDVRSGASDGFSLMFDMNRLFEEYIGEMAKEAFADKKVQLQGPQKAMLKQSGNDAFWGKPDISISSGNTVEHIIDTKWKQLDSDTPYRGVAQSDIYQMLAYSNRYACADLILLYPHSGNGAEGVLDTYTVQNNKDSDSGSKIRIATIQLNDMDNLNSAVIKRLKNLMPNEETAPQKVAA